MLKRKRFEEAKSLGFYIISLVFLFLIIIGTVLTLIFKIDFKISTNVLTAIISAAGTMLAVAVAVFTLYFGFNFHEEVKNILLEFGFYFQLPKDMLRSAAIFGICIVVSIISFFLKKVANFLFGIYSILTLLWGITLLVFVIFRFLKVIKLHLSKNQWRE